MDSCSLSELEEILLKQRLNQPQPGQNPPIPVSAFSEHVPLSAGNGLRSGVQGRNSEASYPKKGKTLKSPPNGGFSNSRAEPHMAKHNCAS